MKSNMMNRLRKIRNKLLKEGNLRKYLAYATGEIVIVVVGILLALYLNNRNQKRTDNKLEIQYYLSMKNQLNEDKSTLIGEMAYNQTYLNQFSYAKKLIFLNAKSKMDTLGKITLNMIRYSDFRRKSNIYQTLVNSGQIVNVKNYRITEKLQNLEEIFTYINRLEDNHATIIISQVIPDIMRIIRFDPLKVENPGMLFSSKQQNNFAFLTGLMMEKGDAYKQAINEIDSTIELIDQEL